VPPLQVVFHSEGTAITGSMFLPDRSEKPVPAVVFLHGYTGHRMEPSFLFPRMAQKLTAQGIAALTFDFRGSGESDGRFEDMTIPGEVKDAHKAVDFVKKASGIDPARLGVLGYSLGGCIAGLMLGERNDIRAGVMWAPAIYMKELMEKRLRESGLNFDTVPRQGLPVGNLTNGYEFFRTVRDIDAEAACRKSSAHILVLQGEDDDVVPPEHGRRLVEALKGRSAKIRYEGIPDVAHGFDSVAAVGILMGKTALWFKEHLKG